MPWGGRATRVTHFGEESVENDMLEWWHVPQNLAAVVEMACNYAVGCDGLQGNGPGESNQKPPFPPPARLEAEHPRNVRTGITIHRLLDLPPSTAPVRSYDPC